MLPDTSIRMAAATPSRGAAPGVAVDVRAASISAAVHAAAEWSLNGAGA